MNLNNLQFFSFNSYQTYYKSKLEKEIVLKIPHENSVKDYFWRAEYNLSIFDRDIIEIHFYAQKSNKITEHQQNLFNIFLMKYNKLIQLVDQDFLREYKNYSEEKDLITAVYLEMINPDQIMIELWSKLDHEHPILDHELFDLSEL